MALRDSRSFEELQPIDKEQETKVCYHESKVQNLIIGYLILERLLFFGISQTSLSFECKDWWVILALSLSWTLVYFLLLLDAVTMLFRNLYQLDIIRKELMEVRQRILVAQNQNDVDPSLMTEAGEFSDGFNSGFREEMIMLDHISIVRRKVYMYFTVCALLVVTAIELYVSKYLLCK